MPFRPTPKSVASLLAAAPGARLVHGSPSTVVNGLTQDTRVLQRGELFVAVAGLERHGLDFMPQALQRGAAAVVAGSRTALADLAAAFYDHPSQRLPVVGVTGTDGKTSTTHLLSAILEAHGLRTGWLTTVNTKLGDELRPNAVDHTTPEAPVVQHTLAEMVTAGLDVAILETSSHALELERVHGVNYRVGVFTNLSPEHINFHGTFEAYRAAKLRLFSGLPSEGLAVLNADDPNVSFFRSASAARVLTFGLDQSADIRAADVALSPAGTSYVVDGTTIRSRLIGRFNIYNWLGAYAAATFLGATLDDLCRAAAVTEPVPGRMNLVDQGQPFAVVVDFAHTPQALEKALDTVRSLGAHKVFLVFGLAGGRDAANRPVMGALAARKADHFVISTDDPGLEDPAAIAAQIAAGARSHDNFTIELDRRAAIRLVMHRAQPGDAVLLAGKGHEQRMVVGHVRQPWNDARVANEVLAELGYAIQAVP
ncbi:MAG TPA: UDP-N-acetylmuramoyl-L-alanyl-D-glutamate--2,6-diaminopimelate ligase [Chloroflexota bacterium]